MSLASVVILVLTAFSCATLGLSLEHDATELDAMVVINSIALFESWGRQWTLLLLQRYGV